MRLCPAAQHADLHILSFAGGNVNKNFNLISFITVNNKLIIDTTGLNLYN